MEVVQCLAETGGVAVDAVAGGGSTALHIAAKSGQKRLVKWLVETGGVVVDTANTENGMTALIHAASHGHMEVVKWLVENGRANDSGHDRINSIDVCGAAQP